MATEKDHRTAVITALTALQAHPMTLAQAKATAAAFYTEVIAIRRFGGIQRSSGERSGELYRVLLRQVARVEDNALNLRAKAAGLENATLTIGAGTTTPLEFETSEPIGEDDGWYSGIQTWTYALI